jgi:Kef-type K+ transport system membrane component KefB
MELFLEVIVLLAVTRILGEAAERLGHPALVGEVIAGILLAALAMRIGDAVPFLTRLATSEALDYVASLGIFFIVLSAGIEMKPREFTEHSADAFAVAFGGVLVPLATGFALAALFLPESGLKHAQALFVGVALSVTAIPATIRVFTAFGLLHSRVGQMVLSAAIFDDILALFLLAILTAVIGTGEVPDLMALGLLLAKVVVFFFVTISLGVHAYPRISRRLKGLRAAALEFSALLAVALAYGLLAEALGMHWVLGAFLAGLYFEPSRVGGENYQDIKLIVTGVTGGLLGPLFFAYIGLRIDVGAITAVPLFLSLVITVAILGKVLGAGLPALMLGLKRREALAVGVGMTSRGAVELIVVGIAYEAGITTRAGAGDPVVDNLISALVLTAVLTTLLAPILLRRILRRKAD